MVFMHQNMKLMAFVIWPVLSMMILVGCEKTNQSTDIVSGNAVDTSIAVPENDADEIESRKSKADEVVFVSGMEVGTVPLPFEVDDVTGPNKGKYLCYRCLYGGRPVVGVFVRDLSESTKSLIKKIDQEVAAHQDKKLAAFVVMLTDDPQSMKPDLEKVAAEKEIKNVPLTIYAGTEGPEGYNIRDEAVVNVMMWVGEVKANRAYPKDRLDEAGIQEVIADTRLIVN